MLTKKVSLLLRTKQSTSLPYMKVDLRRTDLEYLLECREALRHLRQHIKHGQLEQLVGPAVDVVLLAKLDLSRLSAAVVRNLSNWGYSAVYPALEAPAINEVSFLQQHAAAILSVPTEGARVYVGDTGAYWVAQEKGSCIEQVSCTAGWDGACFDALRGLLRRQEEKS